MRAHERVDLASGNLTAGNKTAGVIEGGKYALLTQATGIDGNNTVSLQVEDPAGNWIAAGATVTANGLGVYDLPPGQVRVAIVGNLTNSTLTLVRVPAE